MKQQFSYLGETLQDAGIMSSSDVSGSGSNLSCSEEHEGNYIKTSGLMFQPEGEEECQGFKEDCRFNLDTLGLIIHATVTICLREKKGLCRYTEIILENDPNIKWVTF